MKLITYIGEGLTKDISIWGKEFRFVKNSSQELDDALVNKIISTYGEIFKCQAVIIPQTIVTETITPTKAKPKAKKNDKKTSIL